MVQFVLGQSARFSPKPFVPTGCVKFIGVKDVHTLVVEGTTWGGNEKGEQSIVHGQEEAKKLPADF